MAWALRVLNSTEIFIYGLGFYSWFQNYDESCADSENCQLSLIQTNYASELWMYNIFTKGNVQIVTPEGLEALLFNSTTTDGYTSEIAAWLSLSTTGSDIGTNLTNGTGSGDVYIDPIIWAEPTDSITVQCYPPCTYILPPLTLTTDTTFNFPLYTTSLQVGW